jgi:cyclophilin family peptidyl-prolyl cis-trans isomerase
MPNRRTRERHLAKLASRRAAERRRKRRQRILAASVASAVALGGIGFGLATLLSGGSKSKATAHPTPTPNASPGSNCGYKVKQEPTRDRGPLAPPPFTIDVNKVYTATMKTSMGKIVIQLLPKDAPCAVNSFVYLAGKHFYDGILFHRVVKGFVDQAGDPQGTGAGGPGYTFNDELANSLTYENGTVAMANSGPNTNGSQFFIVVEGGGKQLTKSYTIFGRVIQGLDVANRINAVPTFKTGANADHPKKPVKILSLTVKES